MIFPPTVDGGAVDVEFARGGGDGGSGEEELDGSLLDGVEVRGHGIAQLSFLPDYCACALHRKSDCLQVVDGSEEIVCECFVGVLRFRLGLFVDFEPHQGPRQIVGQR